MFRVWRVWTHCIKVIICSKKKNEVKKACATVHSSRRKYTRKVIVDGKSIEALIDTGSDISLMRADEYVRIGSPKLQSSEVKFLGVGSENITALGEFRAEIIIDEYKYQILIRVVSDTVSRQKLGLTF